MKITVVYAVPRKALILPLELNEGATAGDALQAASNFPEWANPDAITVGVHGRPVALGEVLQAGDRVEIYRGLVANPKEARRKRSPGKRRKV
jgi:putative ubiquitin-RnfH superfamily antitoxin RatB of RatAB toxin-antitoxin module